MPMGDAIEPRAPHPSAYSCRWQQLRPRTAWMLAACLLSARSARAADQLELLPDPVMLTVLLIGFVLLIFPVDAFIFRPLLRVLAERDEKIAGARRRAGELDQDAQASLTRYRSSVREVREAAEIERRAQLDTARSEHASVAAEARAEAERESDRGRAEIQQALVQARKQLRSAAQPLARAAVERILGRKIS